MNALARSHKFQRTTPDDVRELIELRIKLLEERLGVLEPPAVDHSDDGDFSKDEIARRVEVLRQMVKVLGRGTVDPL